MSIQEKGEKHEKFRKKWGYLSLKLSERNLFEEKTNKYIIQD